MVYGLITMNALVIAAGKGGRGALKGVVFWLIVLAAIGLVVFAIRRSRARKAGPLQDDWRPRTTGDSKPKEQA